MNKYNTQLTAIALAVATLLSACSGDSTTTADTTAPTVTISDNTPGTASGDVTFTFTFSEAVTGFTADDITVTNGTKGDFTMATNGLSATLVVTPPSTGSGNIEVAVAAEKFTDASSNANKAAASATQAFTTTADTTNSGLTIVNFDESTPATLDAFEGTSFAAITDGSNKVAQLTKPTSAQAWGGATFLSCPSGTIGKTPAIPFTASNQTISVRVKAPRTGVKFSLEAKDASNHGNLVFAETTNTTTEWETLSFNFANKTFGNAIDPNQVYNMLSIFPNFSKAAEASATKETSNSIYLIDDVKLVGSTATLAACPAAPVSAAPTNAPTAPTAAAANVISIYSNAYTQTTGVTLSPNWGQSTVVSEETIASNAVQKYANFNYQGIDFDSNRINVSAAQGFTHLHVDFWATSSVTSVDVFLINASGEQSQNVPLTASSWTSADIPLSGYTIDRTTVRQLKLVANPSGQTVYLDNIYFRK